MKPNTKHYGPPVTMLRMREVVRVTGCPPATIYKKIATGEFPRGIPLSNKTRSRVGWPSDTVYAWVQARIQRAASEAKNSAGAS